MFGFYLLTGSAASGLPYSFWREVVELKTWSLKIAPFDRYAPWMWCGPWFDSDAKRIARYTGTTTASLRFINPDRFWSAASGLRAHSRRFGPWPSWTSARLDCTPGSCAS